MKDKTKGEINVIKESREFVIEALEELRDELYARGEYRTARIFKKVLNRDGIIYGLMFNIYVMCVVSWEIKDLVAMRFERIRQKFSNRK